MKPLAGFPGLRQGAPAPATEVALLATTALPASQHVPWYAIICLPVLFTAGMRFMDTTAPARRRAAAFSPDQGFPNGGAAASR